MNLKLSPKWFPLAAIAASVLAAAAIAVAALLFLPYSIPVPGGVEVILERGTPPGRLASELKARSVIANENAFRAAVKLTGASRHLQAGRYHFEGRISNYAVIRRIRRGVTADVTVTLPEGSTARRVSGILAREFGVDSASCLETIQNPEFCGACGIDAPSLEGYLYPDTYRFPAGTTVESMLRTMAERFNEVFSDSLRMRSGQLGFSVHQTVILASIIEGEAVLDSERPVISAVYHNRLRKGMALQACPTVQYLLPGGPRRLLNRDLAIASPYNTYLHPGLPPGPVNNPGRKSLVAALYPAPTGYLYMVANGDGSHTFSATLDEHNSAKRRFNEVRRNQKYGR